MTLESDHLGSAPSCALDPGRQGTAFSLLRAPAGVKGAADFSAGDQPLLHVILCMKQCQPSQPVSRIARSKRGGGVSQEKAKALTKH